MSTTANQEFFNERILAGRLDAQDAPLEPCSFNCRREQRRILQQVRVRENIRRLVLQVVERSLKEPHTTVFGIADNQPTTGSFTH